MSGGGVYDNEMLRNQISDQDVERILSGREPGRDDLARLASALSALHKERPAATDETVSRLAGEAAAIVGEAKTELGAGSATSRTPVGPKRRSGGLRRRLATLAAAMLVLVGMSGIALAADESAPGDTFYGLDRALEQIGINDGGATERIAESQRLTESGEVSTAILHLADSIEETEDDEVGGSAAALRKAADNVQDENDDEESQAVRDAVAAMLNEISSSMEAPEFDGAAFGQSVAEMARAIPGGPEDSADDVETETGDTEPRENPLPTEEPGPTENPGNGVGPPDDIGPPEDAGPPAGTPGRP